MTFDTIAVIGAGTMGAGIAQVAAASGHRVKLLDVRPGAAQSAIEQIGRALSAWVDKGRLSEDERGAALSRLVAVSGVAELADAGLAIEVILEDLDAKRALMNQLESALADDAVLASNTSSISITAIACGLRKPQRVAGMHFFNPVPQMKLVEVVSGAETSPQVAQAIFELARQWGKTPVHARSTPGFVVNRIARPYYAETLAMLQDRASTPADIDALARGAGFRMGPCELMDMIGHDVNFAVTRSVFDANFGDRRYAPSLVQQALLDGGRLGRKAGRGFYEGAPPPEPDPLRAIELPSALTLHGSGPVAELLRAWLDRHGVVFDMQSASDWIGLECAGLELHVSDGRSAMQRAAERSRGDLAVIDLPAAAHPKHPALGIAFAVTTGEAMRSVAMTTIQACGWRPIEVRDVAGLWAARTIAMLVNEAADAVWQGVCDESSADLAMTLGTNWPAGPFEWLARFGVEHLVATLDHLHAATRGERYRVSPLLQQRRWQEMLRTK